MEGQDKQVAHGRVGARSRKIAKLDTQKGVTTTLVIMRSGGKNICHKKKILIFGKKYGRPGISALVNSEGVLGAGQLWKADQGVSCRTEQDGAA